MTPGEMIELMKACVAREVEAFDANLAKRLSAIDMHDAETAHRKADDMLADALESLGFDASAKQYKKMREGFYYS